LLKAQTAAEGRVRHPGGAGRSTLRIQYGDSEAPGSPVSIDPRRLTVKALLPQLVGRSGDDLREVMSREIAGLNRISVVRYINELLVECDDPARPVDPQYAVVSVVPQAASPKSSGSADPGTILSAEGVGLDDVAPAAGSGVGDPGRAGAQPGHSTEFCTNCGAAIGGLRFCGNCGTAVAGEGRRAGDIEVGGVDSGGRVTVSRKGVIAVTVIALLVVGIAAAAWAVVGRATESSHTVKGEMTLNDFKSFRYDKIGDSCSGDGGYSDIDEGATVSVKNQSGTLIGSGRLGPGTVQGGSTLKWCVFPFEVGGVKDAQFFQVEVSRRGGLSYSKADMEKNDWTVHASLGS